MMDRDAPRRRRPSIRSVPADLAPQNPLHPTKPTNQNAQTLDPPAHTDQPNRPSWPHPTGKNPAPLMNDDHRVATYQWGTTQSFALQNPSGVISIELSILSVEVADQVIQAVAVDVLVKQSISNRQTQPRHATSLPRKQPIHLGGKDAHVTNTA